MPNFAKKNQEISSDGLKVDFLGFDFIEYVVATKLGEVLFGVWCECEFTEIYLTVNDIHIHTDKFKRLG
jgi:hypothetical protein